MNGTALSVLADNDTATAEASYPRARTAWFVVFTLTIAYVFSFIDRQIVALLVQPIERDFNLSDTQIGLLQGVAFAIFYTGLGLPFGWLADRFSRRTIIGLGVALWSCMAALCGVAKTVPQLVCARMGVGVGEASLSPSAYSLITDFFPANKLGRAFATFSLGIGVGSGIAFIVGGILVNHFSVANRFYNLPLFGTVHGWQMVFIVTALPGLFACLLIWAIREPPRRGLLNSPKGAPGRSGLGIADAAQFLWKRRRFFGPHFAAFGLLAMIAYGMGAWGIEGIRRNPHLHLRPGDAAIILGACALIFTSVGMMAFGTLADWLTAKGVKDAALRACMAAGALTTVLGVATQFASNVWILFIEFALLNLSLTSYAALGPLALNMVTPNQIRGQAVAVYLLVLNGIGLGIGPTIIPLISDHIFRDPTMLRHSIALVCGACGLGALWILNMLRPTYARLVDEAREWRT